MKIKMTKTDISKENLLGDYSRRKLYCLSKTYEELSRLYRINAIDDNDKYIDRKDMFYLKQLGDSKKVFAQQLYNVSEAFAEVADTVVRVSSPLEHKKKALIVFLKKHGIIVHEIIYLEGEPKRGNRITIKARVIGKSGMSASALGMLLSDFLGRSLVTTSDSAQVLNRDYNIFVYEDGPKYSLLSSVSRAVKENEKISGDNFSLEEYNHNKTILMISDGMGSGSKANSDSQKVIELMEKFLEAGFDNVKAISMAGLAAISPKEELGLATLDLCSVDLVNGEVEFVKAGAAPSYIKRGKRVDKITSDTLPLGSYEGITPITQTTQITNNDMLIMMSDGVIDAIENEGGALVEEYISRSKAMIPYELSESILRHAISCQKGRVRDDMTVLVARLASKI